MSNSFVTPMDCSPSGSFVQGISHARTLGQVAISFFRGIFLTHGSNLRLLHWQGSSLPQCHQESPILLSTQARHLLLNKEHVI